MATNDKKGARAAALLYLHAQTGLHPGSGATVGVVDLPVQRERHTQWPVIPATSLKGVLRDACRRKSEKAAKDADNDDFVVDAFGPPTENASDHAGALAVTDARILAFPVRSLKGVFAWVTCPAVLERLGRDLGIVGRDGVGPTPKVEANKALCAAGSPLLVDGKSLVLEEFDFERTGDADGTATWLSKRAVADDATRERLRKHLVVLHDDDFGHFVRHATEVVARVGLDYENKTVRTGALFYQEFLPAETLFYALVLAGPSRRKNKEKSDGNGRENVDPRSAGEILGGLRERMNAYLQIGGDETTGKGLCAVRLDLGEEAR